MWLVGRFVPVTFIFKHLKKLLNCRGLHVFDEGWKGSWGMDCNSGLAVVKCDGLCSSNTWVGRYTWELLNLVYVEGKSLHWICILGIALIADVSGHAFPTSASLLGSPCKYACNEDLKAIIAHRGNDSSVTVTLAFHNVTRVFAHLIMWLWCTCTCSSLSLMCLHRNPARCEQGKLKCPAWAG